MTTKKRKLNIPCTEFVTGRWDDGIGSAGEPLEDTNLELVDNLGNVIHTWGNTGMIAGEIKDSVKHTTKDSVFNRFPRLRENWK